MSNLKEELKEVWLNPYEGTNILGKIGVTIFLPLIILSMGILSFYTLLWSGLELMYKKEDRF